MSPDLPPAFESRHWTSRDGLKLHYRDYAGPADRAPLLCLPGLTRNARDFGDLAVRYAGERRVIAPDMRGRGQSAYARDSATYQPLQYLDDLGALFEQAELPPIIGVGTSLGGLLVMLLAATQPARLAGAVLNDVGPEIAPEGLERIRGYVGQGRSFPTWMHAARALEESQADAYPGFELSDWLTMAKRCLAVAENGRIHFDYDMKIAEPMAAMPDGPAPDMWPAFSTLAGRPVLMLRGELSDVLSEATFARMARELPSATAVTVPGVGHAPLLAEPAALAALDALIAAVA